MPPSSRESDDRWFHVKETLRGGAYASHLRGSPAPAGAGGGDGVGQSGFTLLEITYSS